MLEVAFLQQVDQANAEGESEDGVAEKSQSDMKRQPESLESRWNLTDAAAYGGGRKGHEKC